MSSCHTLTFCSLWLALFPFRSVSTRPTRPFVSWRVPAETVCVLAGSRSQLRDKAPLHTANSSLCVPPLPLLQPPPLLLHPDTGTHTYATKFPPQKSLCDPPIYAPTHKHTLLRSSPIASIQKVSFVPQALCTN